MISSTDIASQTVLQGEMGQDAREQIVAIAVQLEMTEAQAVEWAIMRCGLRISFPNTLLPNG